MKKKASNYMEETVQRLMDKAIKNIDICTCDKCKMDILALTLNKFVPKYTVTIRGLNYVKLNEFNPQFETDIITEIVKSAKIVRKNPKHNVV